jgi:ATP-dependent RNA helicase DeaD
MREREREREPMRARSEARTPPRAASGSATTSTSGVAQAAQVAAPLNGERAHSPGADPGASSASDDDDSAQVQMYLNVGKRDGVTSQELVELLQTRAQVEAAQLGQIRLKDRMTFIAIDRTVFEHAKANLQGVQIKGREIVVEVAKVR